MKRAIALLLVFLMGGLLAGLVVHRQEQARYNADRQRQLALWDSEKGELEAALEKARTRREIATVSMPAPPVAVSTALPDAREIIQQLSLVRISPGADQTRILRQVLVGLQQLGGMGKAALPAVREFLLSGRDTSFEVPGGKTVRDLKGLAGALVPPTLRFGLFDVVRQVGGSEAESIFGETLARSVRGLEVAYIAAVLEDLAPGKYRESVLNTAKSLLSTAAGPDRDQLFGLLRSLDDKTYVATAQAQLIQPNGKVDASAVRYLQQTLGPQSVGMAVQYYQDPRLTEPGAKEPLARLALAYVGADRQAAELFHTAIFDPSLLPNQKRELVEDLNQDGIRNEKTPTPEDLKIIAERYSLTQAYLQQEYVVADKVLNAAFREADKDLRNMLQKAAAAATTGAPAQPK